MEISIENPTKAYIENANEHEISAVKELLSYTNKSVAYQIKLHKDRTWWRNKDPDTWNDRLLELERQLKDCLCKFDLNGKYWIRPGSIPYISNMVNGVKSKVDYPEGKPLPWQRSPKFEPYTYQTYSVEELIKVKHGNISLPTGCGKSFILLMLARTMGLKTVVVTPSRSIFNELLKEFQERLGKKYVGGYGDGRKDTKKLITIAIGRSLTMLKEDSEAYKFFNNKEMMLVDESHTFAAEELHNVCHGVLSRVPYRFFVSATQTRNDGTEKVLESIIGKNVFKMELKDAIEQGYLCPLKFSVISTFSKDNRKVKDAAKMKRIHFLYNENVANITAKLANASWEVKKQSTLILVSELKQIEMLKRRLKVPFAYVHSASKKKAAEFGLEKVNLQEQVDKFNEGEVKVLIGTSAISTGTNIYPTHNTINWVGGSSEIMTKQGAMGRSTRILEKSDYKDLHSPKNFTQIWDFDVRGVPMLKNQLKKRVKWYEESGSKVNFIGS